MDSGAKSFRVKPTWSHSAAGQQIFALVVGLILHIFGYCTENWGVAKSMDPEQRLGVWEMCYCNSENTPDESWYRGFRALITISGLCLMGAILLGFIYTFCKGFSKSWLVGTIIAILITSLVCGIIAYILFAQDLPDYLTLSYSYAVHIVGSIFVLLATISIMYQWYRISFE